MKKFMLVVALALLVGSCATQSAYTGPIHQKEPIVERIVHRTAEYGGQIKTTTILKITNTSDEAITVDVECEKSLATDVRIPPRTIQFYLPHQDDSWCEVGNWAISP